MQKKFCWVLADKSESKSGIVGDKLFPSLQPHSHSRNVACFSLSYCHFHSKLSDKLHFLVLLFLTLAAETRHVMYTRMNHPHFIKQKTFRPRELLPTKCRFVEQTPDRKFFWTRVLYSRINRYLPYISLWTELLAFSSVQTTYKVNYYLKWVLGLILGEY